MPTKDNSQKVISQRSILRNAFGSILNNNKDTPFRMSNNDVNSKYVVDSSLYTNFRKLEAHNKNYDDTNKSY
jgi:hypothetical protein